MKFHDRETLPLSLMGGVIERQRLVVPAQVITALKSYRHACRLAWKLRFPRNLTYGDLAAHTRLYKSHVSDYFSAAAKRRQLPAEYVAEVEAVFGNTVISQYLAHVAGLTVIEQLTATGRMQSAVTPARAHDLEVLDHVLDAARRLAA